MTRLEIQQLIAVKADEAGIVPELALGVCECESNFNPDAESNAGAVGLFQLEPATGLSWGVSSPSMLKDPVENATAGCRYLASMLRHYKGNVIAALAAYNWGLGNVDRHMRLQPGATAADGEASWILDLPVETRNYIQRVPAAMYRWLMEKAS